MEQKESFVDFLQRRSKIIKNPDVFQVVYTPEDIIKRDETYEFFKEIANILKYKTPTHILMRGLHGTGKTVTARYICEEVRKATQDFVMLYVNCRDMSPTSILNHLLQSDMKGISEKKIIDHFFEIQTTNVIIIFDEIDKAKGDITNLLYYFSRPNEIYSSFKYSISTVLISNNMQWDDDLDSALRSSLQLRTVNFKPYEANELKEILKARIKIGFYKEYSISKELINIIARIVAESRHGDCRSALQTLFYAAQKAEEIGRDTLIERDIEWAYPIVIDNIEKERITRLHNLDFYVLYAIAVSSVSTLRSIYNSYKNIILKLPERRYSYSKFYQVINYLENQELIKKISRENLKEININLKLKKVLVEEEFYKREKVSKMKSVKDSTDEDAQQGEI